MGTLDSYNVIKITEEALIASLKEGLIKNIVNNLVSDFKENAEQEIKKEVEKLSIKGVKHFRDLATMRDEVKVYCEWSDENKT